MDVAWGSHSQVLQSRPRQWRTQARRCELSGPDLLPVAPSEFGRDALIVCDNLVRIYQTGSVEVQALQGLDLLVEDGEMVAIVGASGSGKSTLLSILAGVDAPTAGRARVAGQDLLAMSRARPGALPPARRRASSGSRRRATSCPYLTAAQVRRPADDIAGVPAAGSGGPGRRAARGARRRATAPTAGPPRCPAASSSASPSRGPGQPTRACCSPTSRPASSTPRPRAEVFDALRTANRELGATVVVVTHDPEVSGQVARTVAIRDGRTSSEVLRRTASARTHGAVAEEYAVMDRAGRVQVPREYREALALTQPGPAGARARPRRVRPEAGPRR